MTTLKDEMISVPNRLPAKENARVHKEECVYCFSTPEHGDGLSICLVTHFGLCGRHLDLHYEKTGHRGYLRHKRVRRLQSTNGDEHQPNLAEPQQKITKLAIGVEGGFQEPQYEISNIYELLVFPSTVSEGITLVPIDHARVAAEVRSCCQALIACESAYRLQELESLAGTWDGSFVIPTKHIDLVQLSPPPKIPSGNWRCHVEGCDKTENLWMNLTDGKICCGRRFFDGTGGNNHAVEHYQKTGYPLAVKLGTITANGQADVYSYDEDEMVTDPKLEEHLAHFGISLKSMEKTEKTMLEMELDLNQKHEFSRIQESDHKLNPVYGPGLTGMVNLGSSCYISSAAQTLALIPDILTHFSGENATKTFRAFNSNDPSTSFPLQTAKLYDSLESGEFSKEPPADPSVGSVVLPENGIRPVAFRLLVGKGHAEFSSHRQQDVEEYLRWLFEKFEENGRTIGHSPVDALRFECVETLVCGNTSKRLQNRRPETIMSLLVPMNEAINVAEVRAFEQRRKQDEAAGLKTQDMVYSRIELSKCLKMYAATSAIENARSPFDDSPTTLMRSQGLSTFPDYLFVQIRRFTVTDNGTPKKLEVEIVDNEFLDLDPYHVAVTDEAPIAFSAEELALVSQLVDAGFPRKAAQKAVQETRRITCARPEAAFDWLLNHMDDPDVSQSTTTTDSPPRVNPALMEQVTGLGFTPDQARKALRLSNGDVQQAIAYLCDNPTDAGEPEMSESPTRSGYKYRNGQGKYRLVGFISHMGSSTHCGHYVCHLLKKINGEERWVIFNDEKVALSEEPPKGFGYVYLYERLTK